MPTKVHLVKAMVFPEVMYGCEGWTIKNTESRRIDAFELWCWRRLLRVPLNCKEIQPHHPKEISPNYSFEGLMLNMPLHFRLHILQPGCSFGLEKQTLPSQPIQTLLKVQIKRLFHEVSLDITTTTNKWYSYIYSLYHNSLVHACSLSENWKLLTGGGQIHVSLSPTTILPHPSAQSGGSVNTRWTNEHSFWRVTSASTKTDYHKGWDVLGSL